MALLDWIIVLLVFCVLGFIAYKTKQYVKGVDDFLAANRCAGRYLLTLADGMAGLGAIGIIATFQQYYGSGFGGAWWSNIMAPIMLILPLTGFIIYRFRESRVMTIAEFYEKRYSRRFRIFAGILAFIAGIINYGVFPQVTARFFIYFCGIPEITFNIGEFTVNVTLGFVMAVLLCTALVITFRGGQIAIMVTDFLQAQYVNIVFLMLLFILLWKFGISDLFESMKVANADGGQSMLNPFDQDKLPDFTLGFFLIMAFNAIYSYMAWQGNQGYNCSARSPHEAKMARILGAWRQTGTWAVIALIPMFAYMIMNSSNYEAEAAIAQAAIENLGDEGLQRQLEVPIIMSKMLPIGMTGLFVAAMLAAAISTDDTYLHSWGSIFIQDVYLPLTNQNELAPEQHLGLLKKSIFGVAVFVWVFGMIFPLYEYIFMYWAITGAIYIGGAGSVIIGGFYWKRATKQGAWAGMITGSLLAVTGVLLNNIFYPIILPKLQDMYPGSTFVDFFGDSFMWDGAECMFFASITAVTMFILFSLLSKPEPDFNMDKLLNRGKYRVKQDHELDQEVEERLEDRPIWQKAMGIDKEYTTFDKFIAYSILAWMLFWFVIFIVGTLLGLIHRNDEGSVIHAWIPDFLRDLTVMVYTGTDDGWAKYWIFQQGVTIAVGCVTVVWFLWGGFRDLRELLKTLKRVKTEGPPETPG